MCLKTGFHADHNMFEFLVGDFREQNENIEIEKYFPIICSFVSNLRKNFNISFPAVVAQATAGENETGISLVDMERALNARILEIIN